MPYEVLFSETQYVEGRRGVTAHAKIRKDGHIIGTIDDLPERIVVPVSFNDNSEEQLFLAEAKVKVVRTLSGDYSDAMLISEFARQLIGESEIKYTSNPKGSK